MRSALGATALSTVFLLASCGGDPEPQFGPEPSAEPTVASSSLAPAEQEAWEEKTDAGAVAFVEHWIDEFNVARATGETEALGNLGTADCETCNNFVGLIEQIYGAGGYVQTDGWTISTVGELPETGDRSVVPIRVDQAPQELRETADAAVQRNPGGTVNMTATLRWVDGEWRMQRLDLVS